MFESARGQEKLALLQEAWASCEGEWKKSELYLKMTQRKSHSSYGTRVWMTRGQLEKKYGSKEIADTIAENKLNDPVLAKTCVQWHKDAPGNEETWVTWCTDFIIATSLFLDTKPA